MVERSDEDHDRFDALTERGTEPRVGLEEMGEELAATNAEQIGHRHGHAMFGEHGMGLAFEPGPQRDELGPVTHQLTPLAYLRGRDPCFGEHVRSQQITHQLTIALIVLHSAPIERGDLRRGDQVHVGAGGL